MIQIHMDLVKKYPNPIQFKAEHKKKFFVTFKLKAENLPMKKAWKIADDLQKAAKLEYQEKYPVLTTCEDVYGEDGTMDREARHADVVFKVFLTINSFLEHKVSSAGFQVAIQRSEGRSNKTTKH